MIDKIKTIITISLIVILIIGILYSIVKIVGNLFKEPFLITSNNAPEYMVDENLVTTYQTYYTLNDCLINFIESCEKELYDELYNLYINDYSKEITKEEIINELNLINKMANNTSNRIEYKLKKVYSVEDRYILNIEFKSTTLNLIFSFENKGDFDYSFAFVK